MKEASKSSESRRRRRSKAEWVEEVKRWGESGQSAHAYASAHGLRPGTLVAWKSKVGDASAANAAGRKSAIGFLPVRVTEERGPVARATGDEFEVVLLTGRRVRVGSGFQGEALARLLQVVEGGVRC
jgi:hypothetical protein